MLEGPATVLARLQEAISAGKEERGITASLADELLAERAVDTSLDAPTADATPAVEPDAGR